MNTQNSISFEAWWIALRKQTQKQLPIESAFSLPVPVRVEGSGEVMDGFFYAVHRGSEPGAGTARPPIARVLAVYPTGQILKFSHADAEPLFPGLPESGSLGPLTRGNLTSTERMNARKTILDLYPKINRLYFSEQNTQDDASRKVFYELFFSLAEPGLLPYYRELNPDFFDWLE